MLFQGKMALWLESWENSTMDGIMETSNERRCTHDGTYS